jgi:serine/threonine protein kinase
MVVEFLAGGNLRDFLVSRSAATGTHGVLTETEAQTVFSKMMSGLNYAHTHNIIHHNLKLENIM